MFIGIFQRNNEEIKVLFGRKFATATYTRYETSIKYTIAFLNWKYKVSDIDIRKIDHEFVANYESYFKSVHKCTQNSIAKYIKNLGKIVRRCLANCWIERDPFINYKCKIVEVDGAFLSQDVIETVFNKVLTIDRLNHVKDIFLFSYFTGLAYVDVKKLSRKNIGFGVDGERWIFINRTKTETRSNIPLLPIAFAILKK